MSACSTSMCTIAVYKLLISNVEKLREARNGVRVEKTPSVASVVDVRV